MRKITLLDHANIRNEEWIDFDAHDTDLASWPRDRLDYETLRAQQEGDALWGDELRHYPPDPLSDNSLNRPKVAIDAQRQSDEALGIIRITQDIWDGQYNSDYDDYTTGSYLAQPAPSKNLWRSIWRYLCWFGFGAFFVWVVWLFITDGTK